MESAKEFLLNTVYDLCGIRKDHTYSYSYECRRCNKTTTATEHAATIWHDAPECYKRRMCLKCWWDVSAN